MTETEDAIGEEIKEVYAQAGFALYLAQCFEMSLANFVVIYHRATNHHTTVKELLALESANSQKTLGALLRRAKDLCSFDTDALARLDLALEHRNRLSHHFFKQHAERFLSQSGREAMLAELSLIQRSLEVADTLMEATNRAFSKAIGVTEAVLAQELEKIYARAADA